MQHRMAQGAYNNHTCRSIRACRTVNRALAEFCLIARASTRQLDLLSPAPKVVSPQRQVEVR